MVLYGVFYDTNMPVCNQKVRGQCSMYFNTANRRFGGRGQNEPIKVVITKRVQYI